MPFKDPARAAASKKKHYETRKKLFRDRNKARRTRFREIIAEAKNRPCADCAKTYPSYVMDFDHRDPADKSFQIGALGFVSSEEILRREIAKCDVVCANCHRMRTHRQSSVPVV